MITSIHYRTDDGGLQEIVRVNDGAPSSETLIMVSGEFSNDVLPGHCRWDGEAPVPMTEEDKAKKKQRDLARAAPTLRDFAGLIARELSATDKTQLQDFEIGGLPIASEHRAQWAEYRRALRRLSDLGTVAEVLAAWPARPDGKDVGVLKTYRERAEALSAQTTPSLRGKISR